MVDERDLLQREEPYRIPRDAVGARPAGEKRAGPVRLLWLAVVALRFHLWRVLQFGLLAGLFALIPLVIVGLTAAWLMHANPKGLGGGKGWRG